MNSSSSIPDSEPILDYKSVVEMAGTDEGENGESLTIKWMKIAGAVSAYWIVSISMVFLNKYLLSSDDLKLNAPLFITWFQCVVTISLCATLRLVTKYFPRIVRFPELPLDWAILKQVLPLSAVFVGMIIFNNLCLKYVGVAFYYVGRSLTTVFNVIFSYLILNQSQSIPAITFCGVIIGGFALGVDQESLVGTFSVIGVIFGVLASSCVALNSITTKKLLPVVNGNIWRLSFYTNFIASFLFIPLLILSGELQTIFSFSRILDPIFWCFMLIAGVFGFAMGYVVGLQIQLTSPLSHNVSGTAKACFQTILACVLFHEVKSHMWWASNAIVMLGSGGYTEVKRREMKAKQCGSSKTVASGLSKA